MIEEDYLRLNGEYIASRYECAALSKENIILARMNDRLYLANHRLEQEIRLLKEVQCKQS